MPTTGTSHFSPAKTVAYLTAGSAVVLLGALSLTWLLPVDLAGARWVMAVAVFIGWASAVAALMPVVMVASAGNASPQAVMRAYSIGAFLRMGVCLLAAVVIMRRDDLATLPGVLTLMATYLTTLFIESAMVARLLWQMPRIGAPTPPHTPTPHDAATKRDGSPSVRDADDDASPFASTSPSRLTMESSA